MCGIDLVNIRTFDLNLLRALHALLENRNVSAAARQLNLSQPATSAALSRLRQALGDVLLVREGNRMSLSPRAERLLPRVRLLMTEIELALRDDLFDPNSSERAFRIAATDDAIEIIVTPLIERLRIAAPGILMDIVGVAEDVAGDLAAGKIDVAIAAGWWLRHARNRELLLRDRYVGISGNKKRFDLAAYASALHVLVAPHGRNPGVVDSALRKIGMTRKVAITVPDFASAARLVATGSMIATMPSRIAVHYSKHYRLNVFELPLKVPELDIAMAFHPRAMSDPAIIWLMDEFRGGAGRTIVNSAGTRLRPPIRRATVPARQAGTKRRNEKGG
jgi:DNA-binding transcriptional LysR family regulator